MEGTSQERPATHHERLQEEVREVWSMIERLEQLRDQIQGDGKGSTEEVRAPSPEVPLAQVLEQTPSQLSEGVARGRYLIEEIETTLYGVAP